MYKKITVITKLGDHFKVANLTEMYKKPGTVICVHYTVETETVEISFVILTRHIRKFKHDLKVMNLSGINGWIRDKKL